MYLVLLISKLKSKATLEEEKEDKPNQYQLLAKFVFGCMNQKQTLPDRVKQRGLVELDKVLKFASKAAEVLIEIDADNQTS